jgi:hypothetical protein
LLEVEDDDGAVVGTVELQEALTYLEKLEAQIRPVVEGRKKGTEKSAKVRKKNQDDWIAYAKSRIRDMRKGEPTLTKSEAIDRLTDKNEPWPPGVRRRGRSTLEKAMPTLWVE